MNSMMGLELPPSSLTGRTNTTRRRAVPGDEEAAEAEERSASTKPCMPLPPQKTTQQHRMVSGGDPAMDEALHFL
jgi:hypothetical protein